MDKKKVALSPTIEETLLSVQPGDVLELDEVWSFIQKCANKRWLWTAICRRTRQIVAAVGGGTTLFISVWGVMSAKPSRFSNLTFGIRLQPRCLLLLTTHHVLIDHYLFAILNAIGTKYRITFEN
ncbi:MAG: hypothetical protein ACOVSW_24635 [Candidatus Kapaibacteriota bacterium]